MLLATGDVLAMGQRTEALFVNAGDDAEQALAAYRQDHPLPEVAPPLDAPATDRLKIVTVLFADVSDHLAEYATLKAMGYTNGYLASVVLQEAAILAVLGFIPGLAVSLLLYRAAGEATRLPLEMSLPLGGLVLLLTVAMCALSGIVALRKIRSADPAEIF